MTLALTSVTGVFAQGAFFVDNSSISPGLAKSVAGSYYSGVYALQVWYLNGTTLPGNINTVTNTTAYSNLTTDGFTLATNYLNQTITSGNAGTFTLGQLNIPGVTPAASSIIVALAAWTGSGSSFTAAPFAGVIAFTQSTVNYTASPAPTAPALTGWGTYNKDLIMTPVAVPEPTTIALAGLGGAALLAFRRKKA